MPEYEEFKEWLHSFELYRGKKTGDDTEDENRVVGVFKVRRINTFLSISLSISNFTINNYLSAIHNMILLGIIYHTNSTLLQTIIFNTSLNMNLPFVLGSH